VTSYCLSGHIHNKYSECPPPDQCTHGHVWSLSVASCQSEMARMWKEALLLSLEYYSRICMTGLGEGGGTWMLIWWPLSRLAFHPISPDYKLKSFTSSENFRLNCVANGALAESSKYGGSGPYVICGTLSRNGTLFCLTTSVFPASYYSRNADILILTSRGSVSYNHLLLHYGTGSNKQLLL